MRPPLVLAVVLVVACRSGEPESRTPVLPSGSVMGAVFTPIDGAAYSPPQKRCDVAYTSLVSFMFSTARGLCAAGLQQCSLAKSATTIGVAIIRIGTAQQPAIGPGTYTMTIGEPTPDHDGNVELVRTTVTKTDAACAVAPSAPTATGTLTLTKIEGGMAAGSVSISFSDGGQLTGTFNVPVCGSFDVCASCVGVTPVCL